jgi:ribonuclease R
MYYSHFTSPIRRYPDLQIHRIIKEYLHDSLDDTRIRHFEHKLKNVAINCSNTERKAESIERGIKELKIIEYMERFIGKTFTGVISHIVEAGVSVELESGVE